MTDAPKVVFDTNIYLSAILFGGNPKGCLELARTDDTALFVSKAILAEVSSKLQQKFLWEEQLIKDVVEGIAVFARLVVPKEKITVIKEDPSDNRILECAVESHADFIVSGDKKHLLSLKFYKGIPIVSAKEFLDYFYHKS